MKVILYAPTVAIHDAPNWNLMKLLDSNYCLSNLPFECEKSDRHEAHPFLQDHSLLHEDDVATPISSQIILFWVDPLSANL